LTTANAVYKRMVNRRIRIRSIGICFEGLVHLEYQPDLFEPETETKYRKLQEAVDRIQNRYGAGKITKGLVFSAKRIASGELGMLNGY